MRRCDPLIAAVKHGEQVMLYTHILSGAIVHRFIYVVKVTYAQRQIWFNRIACGYVPGTGCRVFG